MSQAQELRAVMDSVKGTSKITSAMQMVAASKMRRAKEQMFLSEPYAARICDVVGHVAASHATGNHPFLQARALTAVTLFVVSTDKGLCGGLNNNLFRHVVEQIKAWADEGISVRLVCAGRKAKAFFDRVGGEVVASVDQLGDSPTANDLIGLVKVMVDDYRHSRCDAVFVAGNEFVSSMVQKPFIRSLLPLSAEASFVKRYGHWDYIYEPDDTDWMLDRLMIRFIESQVYQLVVENIACEQAARQLAMKNATDNAGDMIRRLQLVYNKERQASITQEIAEIVGGAQAIESD